jgi:phospholipid transport system substrate-binding protein
VETKVLSGGGGELPIDYRLHEINGQWKVYDMIIDQISIVSNYRAQFDRVIANSSIKELLQRLKQQTS